MDLDKYPMLKTYTVRENTGSMSSNRLHMQISFAMMKLLELYKQEDFTIVMDCIDDVAIFKTTPSGSDIITYQIKTKDEKSQTFELKALAGKNVFYKLYDHIEKLDTYIKEIYLITNRPLKYKKELVDAEYIQFKNLSDEIKVVITDNMSQSESYDVKGLSSKFVYSFIELSSRSHKEVAEAKLNDFLVEEDINVTLIAAKALYRTILDILLTKQDYEFSLQDEINTVLNKKSYSKQEFEELLNNTKEINTDSITYTEIVTLYKKECEISLRQESSYKRALASIKEKGNKYPNVLGLFNKEIQQYISNVINTDDDITRERLLENTKELFHTELEKCDEKKMLGLSESEEEILYMQNIERVMKGE
ncbi:DUF4297 domain-containing protein [Priestia megaterium]|uniref:dsDNA nuclease domain-containing protein n=1 Tax=Priestia megaterium TaxID=1404 RepID=UPI0011A82468|nr:dsDNA nuclease domain-containing protein [Priestia megaterium]MCM3020098.1 DUF4297 domain-containing protein [Priestia megaterium]